MVVRSYRGVAFVFAGVIAVAAVLHFVQSYTGPLEGMRRAGDYGRAEFSTGSGTYPRRAVDAGGTTVSIARPSRRIASHYWSIDEYVYSIAPPETVVSVSTSAYERRVSNVYAWAEQFHPVVGENPEVVIKALPDLILDSGEGSADFSSILQGAGLPVFRMFTLFTTLDEVGKTILLTGYLTGHDAEARQAHEALKQAIQRAAARKPAGMSPPRILGYGGRYSYGDQTLFNDIVRSIGGINVGAEQGLRGYDAISTEQVVRWNPEWIVAGASRGDTEVVLHRLMNDPGIQLTTAARRRQILVFDNNVFLPMSPFTVLMLDALSQSIYGIKLRQAYGTQDRRESELLRDSGGVAGKRTALLSQEGSTIETAVEILRGVVPEPYSLRTYSETLRLRNHPSRHRKKRDDAALTQEGNAPACNTSTVPHAEANLDSNAGNGV